MNDEPNNTNERLERLLRAWGAEEAERTAQAPAAFVPPSAGRPRALTIVLRWLPAAAAAVLLVAAAAFYRAGLQAPREGTTAGLRPSTSRPTTAADDAELRRLRRELDVARTQLAERDRRLDGLAGLPGQLTDLQEQLQRHEGEAKKLQADLRAATKAKGDMANQLAAAETRLTVLEGEKKALAATAAELPKAQSRLADVQDRLAAAAREVEAARKRDEQVVAELAAARQEAQRLAARHEAAMAAFQRTYLAMAAPGEGGLAARKTAVKSRRMLERLAEMPTDAESEPTRRVLARLEVVLTRLELLDAGRADAEGAFAKLLGGGELDRQIDDALVSGGASPPVRTWLFEARLILTGAGHAG